MSMTADIRKTVEVLSYYRDNSRLFGFDEEEIETLKKAAQIMAGELEHEEDQEAHSEVTIEMEQGSDIALTVWARREGISEDTARQKANRGLLKTARKVGRDWVINEFETNKDNRLKK